MLRIHLGIEEARFRRILEDRSRKMNGESLQTPSEHDSVQLYTGRIWRAGLELRGGDVESDFALDTDLHTGGRVNVQPN